jgi:hypothetical protein
MPEPLSADALLDRIASDKPVVFVIGSAVVASHGGIPGVPTAEEMVALARDTLTAAPWRRRKRLLEGFDAALADAPHRYAAAFRYLIDRRGPDAANAVVQAAVEQARAAPIGDIERAHLETSSWHLPAAVRALGAYIAGDRPHPVTVVTTNFDPLIEVAIRRAGGRCSTQVLPVDGDLQPNGSDGVPVIHLHGWWHGSQTLHTAQQLAEHRPHLHQSLQRLFRGALVVVLGYGGGDDVIVRALRDTAADAQARCDVLWAVPSTDAGPHATLLDAFATERARLVLNVDVHRLLPQLAQEGAPLPFIDPDVLVGRYNVCTTSTSRLRPS